MAFKMRCPKCLGLDYSIERDNRTFGAVAQAFELVFHCRCGKQMFGEVLLKEYERQKRDFESGGEVGGEIDPRARDLERLRQDAQDKGRKSDDGGDADDEPAESDEDEPKEDKRWRQRMAALAADDDDDDDDDDTPSPAPSRSRAKRAAPAPKVAEVEPEPASAADEDEEDDGESPRKKPAARAPRAKAPPKPKAEARPAPPPPEAESEDEDEDEDDGELGEHDEESAEVEGADPTVCQWPGCGKVRRPNSKYCSRACSNKNARSRHKQRGRRPSRGKAATAET